MNEIKITPETHAGGGGMNLPWQQGLLSKWDIIGMNHYYVNGEQYIYVCMGKKSADTYGSYIKEEGKDDKYLWNRLWHKAYKFEASDETH